MGIIGGADGPTSIFLSGSGLMGLFWLLAGTALLLAAVLVIVSLWGRNASKAKER